MSGLICNLVKADIKEHKLWLMWLITFLFGFIWIYRMPKSFSASEYDIEYYRGVFYISLFMASLLLTQEISTGTVKHQMRSVFGRRRIFFSRIVISFLYGAVYWAVRCIYMSLVRLRGVTTIEILDVIDFKWLLIYIITNIVLISTGYLLSLVIRTAVPVLLIMLVFWGIPYYILPFFMYSQAMEGTLGKMIAVLKWTPQFILSRLINEGIVSIGAAVELAVIVGVSLGVSYRIFVRMEV